MNKKIGNKEVDRSPSDQCLRVIEEEVLKKFNNPEESSYCECKICRNGVELC
mgnify:CR=1 FL=1